MKVIPTFSVESYKQFDATVLIKIGTIFASYTTQYCFSHDLAYHYLASVMVFKKYWSHLCKKIKNSFKKSMPWYQIDPSPKCAPDEKEEIKNKNIYLKKIFTKIKKLAFKNEFLLTNQYIVDTNFQCLWPVR